MLLLLYIEHVCVLQYECGCITQYIGAVLQAHRTVLELLTHN